MNTIYTLLSIFFLAALMGIFLLTLILQEKPTPKSVVLIHGIFAATGVILLGFYVAKHSGDLITSLVLFLIAATGGVILVSKDVTGKPIPKWLAIVHGSVAALGFLFLIVYAFTYYPPD
jgi:hypothetical protein